MRAVNNQDRQGQLDWLGNLLQRRGASSSIHLEQPLPKQKNKVVPPPEKPLNPLNIIYILADDLGYADITSTGTKYLNESYRIYTENIDQLLTKNSISMDNFYVQPVCSPTRAALMTGRYPHRVGIPFAFAGTSLIKLPTNIPTLPKALKIAQKSLRGAKSAVLDSR